MICKKCKQDKPLSEFRAHKWTTGKQADCRQCQLEYHREYQRRRNEERKQSHMASVISSTDKTSRKRNSKNPII